MTCSNDRCEGGWVHVLPSYVDAHSPTRPADPGPDCTPEVRAAFDALMVDYDATRAALAESVYPCKVCRPRSFHRWVQGHYAAGHDPSGCAQCVEARRGRLTLEEIIDSAPPVLTAVTNTPDDDLDWTRSRKDLR